MCGTVEEFVVSSGSLTAYTEVAVTSALVGEGRSVYAFLRLANVGGREVLFRVHRPETLRALSRTLRQMADDADRLRQAAKSPRAPLARVTVIP
jgi:hypothetical protein